MKDEISFKEEVTQMNIHTLVQQIKNLDEMVRKQQITIVELSNTIGMFNHRMQQVEASLVAHRINNLGAGPTVRIKDE